MPGARARAGCVERSYVGWVEPSRNPSLAAIDRYRGIYQRGAHSRAPLALPIPQASGSPSGTCPPWRAGTSGHLLEEACLEFAAFDPSYDEHDPRSMIGIRPGIEKHRGMKNVVHAVNDHGRALANQVQDALHTQQIVSCAVAQAAKPCRERLPREWLVAAEAESVNIVMMIVMFMVSVIVPRAS